MTILASDPATRADVTGPTPSSSRKARWGEAIIEALIRLAGISTIVIVSLIFLFLLKEGLPTFLDIPLRQLFGGRWYPIESIYGLMPLLIGSLLVTVGAVIIAVPLGLVAAIYLGEIAPSWLREILKPLIEVLAGIPSIVLGFLGWVVLAPIIQGLGAPTGLTASVDSCWGIRLSWNEVAGADSYYVRRGTEKFHTTALFYRDTGAPAGSSAYWVAGFDSTAIGDSASATGYRLSIPTAPTGLAASDDSCGVIRVTWNASSDATAYEVRKAGTPLDTVAVL